MGKIIGGGLPAAAYGGKATLMERIAPAGDVYQAGTLSGNPLAVQAALASLAMLDEQAYLRLAATTEALADGAARGRRERRAHDRTSPRVLGLVTPFFADAVADATTRSAKAGRPRGVRRVVPRAARPRRLRAAVAVRGVVPVDRAHAGPRRPHRRGRRGGVPEIA